MSQPPKLLKFRIIIANLPKSVFLKRKPAEFWHPIKDLLRSVPTKTRNQVTGQADAEIFEPEKCDVDVSRRAFCPYKDAKEAWEAYHYLQGYLWSLDGYQSVLVVRLYKVDASGRAHRLAGPDEDDIESTYPSPVPSSASSVTSSGAATIRQPPVRSYIPAGYIGKIPPQYGQGKRSIDQHKQLGSDPASDMSLNSYVSSPYMTSGNSEPATQPLGLHIPSPHQCCTPPTPLNSPYSIAIEVPKQRPGPEVFTPALTSTSRNSSISSISTAFLSSTASNCTTTSNFHASSSISSSATAIHGLSQAYTSSRALPEPERGGPDAYKIRVQGVKAGVSEVQFHKDVLEKKFGIYTQHAGIEIVNRDGRPYVYVGYHSKNGAKKAAQELNNFKFMGKKLQVQLE